MSRIVAIYLPQFHPIPENDLWWGKGFTEWTNVGRAKPLFRGHYQPRVPSELGYYDLRLPEVRKQQAELAREHGIEGFCYYHYWFGNGKQLLEMPFNEVLKTGEPDFPFCLCWANHSWTNKTWEKSSRKVGTSMLMEQTYPGDEDDRLHFQSLLPAFRDRRYMTVDGKLIFVIYHPYDFPDVSRFISNWRKFASEEGLPGFFFVGMSPATSSHIVNDRGETEICLPNLESSAALYQRLLDKGFDAVNSFGKRRGELMYRGKWDAYLQDGLRHFGLKINTKYDYERATKNFFAPEDEWENVFPTIMPQYDRTARIGNSEGIFVNSTPDKFLKHVEQALSLLKNKSEEHKVLFLDAWNEWAEGCYVEPDLKYGRGYLEAIKTALNNEKMNNL